MLKMESKQMRDIWFLKFFNTLKTINWVRIVTECLSKIKKPPALRALRSFKDCRATEDDDQGLIVF